MTKDKQIVEGHEELKELIRKEMVRSRADVMKVLLERAKRLIMLSEDGHVHFATRIEGYTQPDKVLAYLIGKWFAAQADLAEEETATYEELSRELGIPIGTVKSATHRLSAERLIENVGKARYRISYTQIEPTIDNLLRKVDS